MTWNPYATGMINPYDGKMAGIRLLGFALRSADVNRWGTSYAYKPLSNLLSNAAGVYIPDGEALSVRVVDYYGDWAAEHGLDAINVNTSAALNTVLAEPGGYLKRDAVGFVKYSPTAWTISGGVIGNASASNDNVGESVLGHILNITSLSNRPLDKLELRFDYNTAEPAEKLYVHLWGYVNVSSGPNTRAMNLNAPNSNAWEASGGAMIPYNLGKTNGVFTVPVGSATDAAIVLTGSTGAQTFSNIVDLSTFTTAPNTVSGYDYLAIGFGREVGGTTMPALTIQNLKLSIVGGDVLMSFAKGQPARHPAADPDDDRTVNAIEYALGGNPTNDMDGAIFSTIGHSSIAAGSMPPLAG